MLGMDCMRAAGIYETRAVFFVELAETVPLVTLTVFVVWRLSHMVQLRASDLSIRSGKTNVGLTQPVFCPQHAGEIGNPLGICWRP